MSPAEQEETGRSAPEQQQTKHNATGHDERAIEQKSGSETEDARFPNDFLPPAQPQYILRGHSSQIHAVVFLRKNTRLLTGDADGWTVLWNLATKRPVAVWRAHDGPILGLSEWTPNRIIT